MTRKSASSRIPRAKILLMPLSRQDVDDMALRYHLVLDALQRRQGSAYGLQMLIQVTVLTVHLDSSKRARVLYPDLIPQVVRDMRTAFACGVASGEWFLEGAAIARCAAVLTEHDRQLRMMPRGTLFEAVEYLKRLENEGSVTVIDPQGERIHGSSQATGRAPAAAQEAAR